MKQVRTSILKNEMKDFSFCSFNNKNKETVSEQRIQMKGIEKTQRMIACEMHHLRGSSIWKFSIFRTSFPKKPDGLKCRFFLHNKPLSGAKAWIVNTGTKENPCWHKVFYDPEKKGFFYNEEISFPTEPKCEEGDLFLVPIFYGKNIMAEANMGMDFSYEATGILTYNGLLEKYGDKEDSVEISF